MIEEISPFEMPLFLLNADHLGSHTQNDTVNLCLILQDDRLFATKENIREIVLVLLKVRPRAKYCVRSKSMALVSG